jgi:transcriptional regulator with XRE-family HTH domain
MDDLYEYRKRIGNNIKNARKQAGYKSQRQLAKKLSFSHDKLARIERGEATPSNEDINEIAQVLGVSPEILKGIDYIRREMLEEVEKIIDENKDLNRAYALLSSIQDEKNKLLPSDRFLIYRILGKLRLKNKQYELAIESFKNALSETILTKDLNQRLSIYRYLTYAYAILKDYENALNYIKMAISYEKDEEKLCLMREAEKILDKFVSKHVKLEDILNNLLMFYLLTAVLHKLLTK